MLALWRATGCLRETALGLAMGDRLVGRTDVQAAATLEADPRLAGDLERCIAAAWSTTTGARTGR